MKRPLAWLGAAALALAGSIAAGAAPRDGQSAAGFDQAAVLQGTPRTLSAYGFFAGEMRDHQPAAGVTLYRLNTPLYSDGADKLRFIALPRGKQLRAQGGGLLEFPVGTALIKTFAFGEGEARRLIETRLLLHRSNGWVALPYRWNDEQTEARLALAGGRVEVERSPGERISYRIPNMNQCKECHGLDDAIVPLGPTARNLPAAWLEDFAEAGHLDRVPTPSSTLPDWGRRDTIPIERAARAYLEVNCAHCHRPGAMASNSGLDLRWEQDDPVKLGVGKRPVAAGRGSGGLDFDIAPGDPARSIVVHRMGSTDPGVAMPELGKSTVDEEGLAVIEAWIAGMVAP